MATEIKAELVGNVWKVEAKPGDQVEEDDILVILESMKMEIPVLTEYGGVITDLTVQVGDVVQEGDVLAVVEPAVA